MRDFSILPIQDLEQSKVFYFLNLILHTNSSLVYFSPHLLLSSIVVIPLKVIPLFQA
jgi:hypothetical protein